MERVARWLPRARLTILMSVQDLAVEPLPNALHSFLQEQQDLSRSDDLELRNELCQDVKAQLQKQQRIPTQLVQFQSSCQKRKVLPICLSEIVPRLVCASCSYVQLLLH